MTEPVEEFSTWLLTGTAAILALVVANISSITQVISEFGLRWGLALLTISMVAGVIVKQFGIMIRKGVALVEAIYAEFQTPAGAEAFQKTQMNSDTLAKELAAPFFWPFKRMMEKSAHMGAKDPLWG